MSSKNIVKEVKEFKKSKTDKKLLILVEKMANFFPTLFSHLEKMPHQSFTFFLIGYPSAL